MAPTMLFLSLPHVTYVAGTEDRSLAAAWLFSQVAKVYISIFSNSDAAKVLAVNSLKKLQGYVRTQIAHNMNLRLAPEIRFLEDEAALRGAEVRMLVTALCSLQ